MSNWQSLPVNGVPAPGAPTTGGGGNPLAGFRSIIDARRSASTPGRTPQAEYPDGYLGSINTRRSDRLLDNVQSRLTQRSYQRGVHKGDRIDPQDYYWNDQVGPQMGIEAQARGQKWTQQGSTPMDQINHMGKNHLLSPDQVAGTAAQVGIDAPQQIDPVRRQRMSRLLPKWR